MLDNQLDALNTALDDIEEKNSTIHAQLLQLLQSNREIRQQLQETNAGDSPLQQQQLEDDGIPPPKKNDNNYNNTDKHWLIR